MFPHSKLQDADIQAATPKQKPYKLSEGGGLYILINPNGSKYWRLKYRFDGRERGYAIGVYPKISIGAAIVARDDAKELIKYGIDPIVHKKMVRETRIARLKTPKIFEFSVDKEGRITITKFKQSLTVTRNEIEALQAILKLSLRTQR